jgi:hypothetical protein
MPLSGWYTGTSVTGSAQQIDLRVDLGDAVTPFAPVLHAVSGDLFDVQDGDADPRTNHLVSWVCLSPQITSRTDAGLVIEGEVSFWGHPVEPGRVSIAVPLVDQAVTLPLTVTLTRDAVLTHYTIGSGPRPFFRDVALTIDVCRSTRPFVEPTAHLANPFLPHPADLVARPLGLTGALAEAGIKISLRTDHTVEDVDSGRAHVWLDAELHAAMEARVGNARNASQWPQWALWGLCGRAGERSRVAGIMFDTGRDAGPERQGFAVFRGHPWFRTLQTEPPADLAAAAAQSQFLSTWVHEIGHSLNLAHSGLGLGDASWMTQLEPFERQNGVRSFLGQFRYQFNAEELRHIRHGDLKSVAMGGDPFRLPTGFSEAEAAPTRLELVLRARDEYELMAPVRLEAKLQNLLPRTSLVDSRLQPEAGGIRVFIKKLGGDDVWEHRPLLCRVGDFAPLLLAPVGHADNELSDRRSEPLDITFGRDGFAFREAGTYVVRCLYPSAAGAVWSNAVTITVTEPEPAVQDLREAYFEYDVGLAYYFHGSRSPRLTEGLTLLHDLAQRRAATLGGAELASKIAPGVAEPFSVFDDGTLRTEWKGDPDAAIASTEQARARLASEMTQNANLSDARLALRRAEYYGRVENKTKARGELGDLIDRLRLPERGVREPVIRTLTHERARYR